MQSSQTPWIIILYRSCTFFPDNRSQAGNASPQNIANFLHTWPVKKNKQTVHRYHLLNNYYNCNSQWLLPSFSLQSCSCTHCSWAPSFRQLMPVARFRGRKKCPLRFGADQCGKSTYRQLHRCFPSKLSAFEQDETESKLLTTTRPSLSCSNSAQDYSPRTLTSQLKEKIN